MNIATPIISAESVQRVRRPMNSTVKFNESRLVHATKTMATRSHNCGSRKMGAEIGMGLSHRDRRRKSAEMLQMTIAPVKRAKDRLTLFFGSNPIAISVKEPVIRIVMHIPAISIQNNIGIYFTSPKAAIAGLFSV